MNNNRVVGEIGRRDLLKFGLAGVAALGLGGQSRQARAAEATPS